MNDGYSLSDVGRLLGLSRSVIYGLIDAGFVAPTRGRRREYRFTFHDLVLLRAAQGLSQAKIPRTRILRSLRRLRAQLPEEMPLTGLRIEAVGDAVVVTEGARQWQPDSGQYVLQFQVASPQGHLSFMSANEAAAPTAPAQPVESADAWFQHAVSMEPLDVDQAYEAYRRALALNDRLCDAYVNLGRLLHERRRLPDAERVYRDGLAHCGRDATLLFNLGVLQEDLDRPHDAADSYRAAVAAAPDLADAHFNLARLSEAHGSPQEALRHWSAFRKLTMRRR